jgi:glycosyltransferase involved in cell wall biosynthesis
MGFGLPAIGTTQGATAEIIHSGENGYLIDPGDSTALSTILDNLHQDRQRLASLSLAAQQRYFQFPGWEQSMEKVHAFLSIITQPQGN